jgi:hypothetical protein
VPAYRRLDTEPTKERILDGLARLRAQLDAEVPARTLDSTLLLATWNIREFDTPKYGERTRDAYYFLAEVISHFDLVAVQEVNRDLTALYALVDLLGPDWCYVMTDATEGRPGNDERMAFLYDSRKVAFTGLAGEIVLPDDRAAGGAGQATTAQLARTPYTVGFRCGWTTFQLATVHILWGDSREDQPERTEEIRRVARFLAARADDPVAERASGLGTFVLLGDFNIFRPASHGLAALAEFGWEVPVALQALGGSNVTGDRKYDQIAVRPDRHWFEPTGRAGVFHYYQSVMRDDDEVVFAPDMGKAYTTTAKGEARTAAERRTYYRSFWRTFQMSDHAPLWMEVRTDYSAEFLAGVRGAPPP